MDGLTEQVSLLINNFDIYYEMSDSTSIQEAGRKQAETINRKLGNLATHQFEKLYKSLTPVGKIVYERYFIKK